jgi:esterase
MELNYKQFGQGEPIIILHGLFGMLDNWQTVARKLAENYTVFIIDQRNHGKSPHDPELDYPTMAEDLKYFMEQNWIYKAHLIGHSMGGKTVMQFALEYPDMVDKLIVVDIAPKKYEGGHQAIFEALFSLDLDKIQGRSHAETQLGEKIEETGIRQFLLKNLSRKKEGGYTWKMNLSAIFEHYEDILDAISGDGVDMETLFIKGGNSKYIQEKDRDIIVDLFPNFTIQTVDNAGHWVHAEQPAILMDMVLEFLSTKN